jgi:quercetin dioxygenase-like cupin family protein
MLESKNTAVPDDKKSFDHGEISLVNFAGFTVGRAHLRPGWRWSTDVKPLAGTSTCQVTHRSYVVSGRLHVAMSDGRELELGPGDAHLVGPGHDAWVVGDEACVTIDFIPAGDTAGGRAANASSPSSATRQPEMPGAPSPRRWVFLGVLVDMLTGPGAPVTVAEAVLPEGASPPAHVHAALDDSFYILDGRMVLHCGEDIWQAGPGSWVQFPAGVPHTFRVLGGPARILMVHADDSFLAAVRQIGHPATSTDVPDTTQGPSIEELDRALAAHGITNVGPPMEQADAERLLRQLTEAAIPT